MRPEPVGLRSPESAIDLNETTITLLREPAWQCGVLVIEDDSVVRLRLADQLKLAGYDVHTAASDEEALRILSTTTCHVVLTDWHMPGIDGPMLCRKLRLKDRGSYVYIVMLTGRSGKRDILSGFAAGADDYIIKGAVPEEILARLDVGRRITGLEHSLRKTNHEHQRLSVTDPLTGTHNRRYLMKYLPRELERSRRYDRPLAILSCDIDGFKRVNDSFGHQAGDEVLQAFVTRATRCLRQSIDWIARSGGEEFVIVLPETTLSGASSVAKKVRQILAARQISTCAGPLTVTVSIGVTALEGAQALASATVTELLRAADHCLYVSKKQGKDRATAASAVRLRDATRADWSLK